MSGRAVHGLMHLALGLAAIPLMIAYLLNEPLPSWLEAFALAAIICAGLGSIAAFVSSRRDA